MTKWKHWRLDIDTDEVGHLILDVEGKSVNVLTREVIAEFGEVVGALEKSTDLKGVMLLSGKAGGFVYGADINEFEEFSNEEEVGVWLEVVHGIFGRFARLPLPSVAGIEGYALGGGLELALLCKGLVATSSPKTQLGFPEVTLGLLPGYGGTGRAYQRIGAEAILDMMITGRMVKAKEAFELGLVDALTDGADTLPQAMKNLLKNKPASQAKKHKNSAFDDLREKYLSRLRPDHTPAPFAIIDHVEAHAENSEAMSEAEKDIFPALMLSGASKGLRRVFALQDRVRREARGKSDIKRVHVIGAGVMGGDIAALSALSGFETSLSDISFDATEAAIKRGHRFFERKLAKEAKARLIGIKDTDSAEAIKSADIIIEAVAEDIKIKQKVFADIEKHAKSDAILASNTSAIRLEEIAEVLSNPKRLIGLHFFNPATVLPLVEVVAGADSDNDFIARAKYFARELGKMPIECQSASGFLVNRALLPYVLEAIALMLDGCDADMLDEAMLDFGMPMGPIELADQIGLDVMLAASLPLGIPQAVKGVLEDKIKAGELGRKTAQGFYGWEDKRAARPHNRYPQKELEALAKQLLAPMIKASASAVKEKVVADADIADVGLIFGAGFPRFRGGVLYYARNVTP